MRKIDLAMVIWAGIGTVFWIFHAIFIGPLMAFAIYYPLWLGIVGTLAWTNRAWLAARIGAMRLSGAARFIVLGYGAVLTEEVLAGIANHLPEGFSPPLLLARIVQFQVFNLFTFFGFVVGWYLLTRYLAFSRREVFYLAGVWGLYAEKIIFWLPIHPLAAAATAGPTIMTYALIIAPAMLGQEMRPNRWHLHPVLKYPLAYGFILLCSLPAILLLMTLRARWPFLFPPPSMAPI